MDGFSSVIMPVANPLRQVPLGPGNGTDAVPRPWWCARVGRLGRRDQSFQPMLRDADGQSQSAGAAPLGVVTTVDDVSQLRH